MPLFFMTKKLNLIKCPNCNKFTKQQVVSTKTNKKYIQIRRRLCIACNHRWYTIQYPEISIDKKSYKVFYNELIN